MKFIGLLILSAAWLGFILFDSSNALTNINVDLSQGMMLSDFITTGLIPVLCSWSVFLMLSALIESQSQQL